LRNPLASSPICAAIAASGPFAFKSVWSIKLRRAPEPVMTAPNLTAPDSR
jgi:hypothetical protein